MRHLVIQRNYLLSAALILALAGCHAKKQPDTANFKAAINDHYKTAPVCVWPSPVKFPAQADAANDSQTRQFDALTDAGLLTRTAEEKKRFLIGSKQVNDYDASDKGRQAWTPDSTQPGYANFCYGHREVTAIDTFTTATSQDGVNSATVSDHYRIAGVPDWAQAAETKTAFPNLQEALDAPQLATAKLVETQNGWQFSQ